MLVLRRAFGQPETPVVARVSRLSEFAALGLAIASLLLGFAAVVPAFGLPAGLIANPLAPKDLIPTLLVIGGGLVLATGLAQRPLFGGRSLAAPAGAMFENADRVLRHWPVASISLFATAAAFGVLLG